MFTALYLYRTHDADLIGLLEEVGKKTFGVILKDSLRVLTRPGYTPKVIVPKFNPLYSDKERYQIYVSIQSKKDEDIDALLSHVRERQVNSFIKMALRFYLGAVPTLSSMLDTELIKTMPVYTPNGVIVFSNNTEMPSARANKRSTRAKRDTISKANTVIRQRLKTAPVKEVETVEPVKEVKPVEEVKVAYEPIQKEEVSFATETPKNNNNNLTDEDDVLSLLAGLID